MAADKYDFVVVGAGSAGCALTNRLSSDPSASVLLVEAGGADDREAIRIPRQYFALGHRRRLAICLHATVRNGWPHHLMPRGRVLGGTSSLNGMVYLRGARSDYDRWAEAECSGWTGRQSDAGVRGARRVAPSGGPGSSQPLTEAMVEAAIQAGFPYNPSFDSGTLDGAGWNKSTIANSERFNAYRAFVAPVLDRPNLHLQTDSRVLRLAMDGTRARCGRPTRRWLAGDDFRGRGDPLRRSVRFAPLLLLSGIGPVSQLERLGIAPVADLAGGREPDRSPADRGRLRLLQPISDCNAYATEGCARLARRRTAPTATSRSRLPRSHTSPRDE